MRLQTDFSDTTSKIGECLAEIKEVDIVEKIGVRYLTVFLEVSNFKLKKHRVKVNIFSNSYGISEKTFLNFMETNDKEELLGKLFYCKITKNKSQYETFNQLYLKVEESTLFFDPRKKKQLATRIIKGECSLKGIFE